MIRSLIWSLVNFSVHLCSFLDFMILCFFTALKLGGKTFLQHIWLYAIKYTLQVVARCISSVCAYMYTYM